MGSKVNKIMKQQLKIWIQCVNLKWFFVLLGNSHFYNVVFTLTNVVKLNVEKSNVTSTLPNVVYINVEIRIVDSMLLDVVSSNVEIRNIVSTLIWRCPTSRRPINQKTTLKQRWNVCWVDIRQCTE